jgi:hypothetical protein
MLFEVTMTGNVGPPVQRTLMTGEGRASILNFTYPFVVGREDYSEIGELEISLIIDQSIQYNIKFQSSAHRTQFKLKKTRKVSISIREFYLFCRCYQQ